MKRKSMSEQNTKKATKQLPTQMMLMIRGFLGLYLLYLAVDLIKNESMVNPRMIIIICSVLFVISGIILFILSARSFLRGEYVGGKADIEEDTSDDTPEEIEVLEEEDQNIV